MARVGCVVQIGMYGNGFHLDSMTHGHGTASEHGKLAVLEACVQVVVTVAQVSGAWQAETKKDGEACVEERRRLDVEASFRLKSRFMRSRERGVSVRIWICTRDRERENQTELPPSPAPVRPSFLLHIHTGALCRLFPRCSFLLFSSSFLPSLLPQSSIPWRGSDTARVPFFLLPLGARQPHPHVFLLYFLISFTRPFTSCSRLPIGPAPC